MMAWVAPAVMVISVSGSYARPCSASILVATASRSAGTPGMGGYRCVAGLHGLGDGIHQFRGAFEVWKALPQVDGLVLLAARADITVKMVVPTLGQACWESRACGRQKLRWSWWGRSEFVVVDVAGHGAGDQFAAQAVAEQFGKLVARNWRR